MPWLESTPMSQRREFVRLAQSQAIPFAELCRRFNISRKTGYKWCSRASDLREHSRRPLHSPTRTPDDVQERVVGLRKAHPAWGGRKIARRLSDLTVARVPHPSTITHILDRHGLLHASSAAAPSRYQRFEHERPNSLWQMDFKGDFAIGQGRCHPLTVIDDHARYNVVCGRTRAARLHSATASRRKAQRRKDAERSDPVVTWISAPPPSAGVRRPWRSASSFSRRRNIPGARRSGRAW